MMIDENNRVSHNFDAMDVKTNKTVTNKDFGTIAMNAAEKISFFFLCF